MALVGEKLASDAMLDKVLHVCSGHWPIETYTEGLAYKGPSRGMVTAETDMNFSQELPPFFLGDTSLKYSSSAFLVEFSLVNFVGFRVPQNFYRRVKNVCQPLCIGSQCHETRKLIAKTYIK